MCLRVDVSCVTGRVVSGRDLFACVCLMRGECDSRLVWPFRGDITIQLVNHDKDQDHRVTTVLFDDAAVAKGASERVTSGNVADFGSGSNLISLSDVESPRRYYLINDSLTFRVTKIVVRSV